MTKEYNLKYIFSQLTHHTYNNYINYLNYIFDLKNFSFTNKSVLDVGGGSGIISFFCAYNKADYVINLEPNLSGSMNSKSDLFIKILKKIKKKNLEYSFKSFLDYDDRKFDVIIFHDSINHIDEIFYSKLDRSKNSYNQFKLKLLLKIDQLLNDGGRLIITDCSNLNFFNILKIKNPFAPSINWNIHKDPTLLSYYFNKYGYQSIYTKWTPLKRLGKFGNLIASLGRKSSFFLQSHYVIAFDKIQNTSTKK